MRNVEIRVYQLKYTFNIAKAGKRQSKMHVTDNLKITVTDVLIPFELTNVPDVPSSFIISLFFYL